MADFPGDYLIEGNGVAKSAFSGVGSGSEKRNIGRVRTIDSGMGNAAKNSEIRFVGFDLMEVGRKLIVLAAGAGKKAVRKHAQVVADSQKTPRRFFVRC